MRTQIAKWIEHVTSLYETGLVNDDLLAKAIVLLRDEKTDEKLIAELHQIIYDTWYSAAEKSPTGMLPGADILYAAELATRENVDEEMVSNASIALAGANCKAKSTLIERADASGTKSVSGWNQTKFVEEKTWQAANLIQ